MREGNSLVRPVRKPHSFEVHSTDRSTSQSKHKINDQMTQSIKFNSITKAEDKVKIEQNTRRRRSRSIRIRAPSDLAPGSIIKAKMKGRDIKATVVSVLYRIY